MGRLLFLVAMMGIASLFAAPAMASVPQAGSLGAGISIGAPMSVTGKYFLTPKRAVDLHIGGIPFFRRGYHGSFMLAADLLQEIGPLYEGDSLRVSIYGGPGAIFVHNTGDIRVYDAEDGGFVPFYDFGIGARFPVGVHLFPRAFPIELAMEISPAILLHFHTRVVGRERMGFDLALLNVAFSARYYFR